MKVFQSQRQFNQTPEILFNALEDATLLAQWWGPDGFTNTFNVFEFKPQGKWSFVMHGPDGTGYKNENVFLEIEKPHKVVIRHDGNPYFTLTISIENKGEGSILTFHQEFDDEEVGKSLEPMLKSANEQVLNKLEKVVSAD